MTIETNLNDPLTEWSGHSGAVVDVVSGQEIIECEHCGFRHVVPLPTVDALVETYATEYYGQEKPAYLIHAGEDYEWATLNYRDRLDILEAHLGDGQRSLLDIGSGPGFFLKFAADCGWRVHGIEPSAQAAAHTREMGLPVTQAFFGSKDIGELGPFDVVHMNNMLEHVPNPRELIENASTILSDNGLICVGVPNDYNPLQEVLRDKAGFDPWWIVPSHHLNYFTFDSLSGLLTSVGFRVLSQTTSFPMELFLLMGDNYVGDDALGRACHNKRKQFELLLQRAGQGNLRRELYEVFAKLGLGREAIVIAQKA